MNPNKPDFQHVSEAEFDELLREAARTEKNPSNGLDLSKLLVEDVAIPPKWAAIVSQHLVGKPIDDLEACLLLLDAIVDRTLSDRGFVLFLDVLDSHRAPGATSVEQLLMGMVADGYIRSRAKEFRSGKNRRAWLTAKGQELVGERPRF